MNPKIKWLLYLSCVLLITSACNLINRMINPVDEVVSEIEELAEGVDIESIEREIETIATDMPVEIPDFDDFENLQETAQAFQEGFESGEVPPDIPIVDVPVEILMGSKDFLSYTTPLEFETVLMFYQEEMIAFGWEPEEEEAMILGETAILQFHKPDRDASITLATNPQDETTVVMISIQSK
jgi:hypothetical protein